MQTFNQELVKCIEDLKATKANIEVQIDAEEQEKLRLQREVDRINGKIGQLFESLDKKMAARTEYERTIQETEAAYNKILESSQLLLNMVKREAASLDHTLSSSSSSGSEGSGVRRISKDPLPDSSLQEQSSTCHSFLSSADGLYRRKKMSEFAVTT